MDEKEEKPTVDEVIRYASDILHATQPQPAPVLIMETLAELKAKLKPLPEVEDPPKNFADAISKIEAKIGKLEKPPKVKPDFKTVLEASRAAEAAAKGEAPKPEAHHAEAHHAETHGKKAS